MVYKVSKGGVRSGNTLRGLHSKKTKLYGRHACLIGHSSLDNRHLDSFLRKTSEEDSLVGETLKRTDVLLSLNKQQRWQVPATINQMISYKRFDQSLMVSLLERHKLKRKANCVRFASNNGRLPNVEPKQRRKYFSLSSNTITDVQSRRERRKLRADEFKKLMGSMRTVKSKRSNPHLKTINAYTYDSPNKKGSYHVEVLYPSPQSCSLTFNPKYTDVILDEGKSGHLEVKANVKARTRGKTHHRRRLMARDFGDISEEVIQGDISDMWEDYCDTEYEDDFIQGHEDQYTEKGNYNNFLGVLLSQAEKARNIVGCKQQHNKERNQLLYQNLDKQKFHIVYMDSKKEDTWEKVIDKADSSHYLQDLKCLNFAKVILKSTETTSEFLKEKFGGSFSEASCQPRRFLINITDEVTNVLSTSKNSSISFLVFIYDGIYDDDKDVYRVVFNSQSCESTPNLSEYIPFSQISFESIVNSVIGFLLDNRDKGQMSYDSFTRNETDKFGMYKFLHNCTNVTVSNFNPTNALSDIIAVQTIQEGNAADTLELASQFYSLSSSFDQYVFCDICYETINSMKIDATYGTKLSKCEHLCCDVCWASHFQIRLREGSTSITCPGYNCNNEIGLVTLLSIVHISGIALLLQRKAEEEVEVAENAKWCPNSECGCIIKINSGSNDLCQDVVCTSCGSEICFSCLGPAHWPARCEQAGEYLEKFATLKPPSESKEEEIDVFNKSIQTSPEVYEVEGRICPKCQRFINKNGGCNNMICKCGYDFCWQCMKPFHNNFYGRCEVNDRFVSEHTRLLRVHHSRYGQGMLQENSTFNDCVKKGKSKQKISLYQRAVQQKLEVEAIKPSASAKSLIKKILAATHKDLQFKKKVITMVGCQTLSDTAGDEELKNLNVKSSVVHLITSSQEIKRTLHHVAEFTYVLLQDTHNSVERRRVLRLADDMSGICTFFSSILEFGNKQDVMSTFERLLFLQEWAKRVLDALISDTKQLRRQ